MGKNKGGAGKAEPPAVESHARQAAKQRASKGNTNSTFPWMMSLAVLALAIGFTVLFVRSPLDAVASPGSTTASSAAGGEFKPQNRKEQCASWVRDGECENNAEFMQERCPKSCKKKKPVTPPKPKKPSGPPDKNPNCATWAAGGECESNPDYMLAECPASCSGNGAEAEPTDIHQDCAAWVQDGECYRNVRPLADPPPSPRRAYPTCRPLPLPFTRTPTLVHLLLNRRLRHWRDTRLSHPHTLSVSICIHAMGLDTPGT